MLRMQHADAERSADDGVLPSSRPITLGEIEFLNDAGEVVPAARSRSPLTVRIHYRCDSPLPAPLFSFSVENEATVYVANPGMRKADRAEGTVHGEGYVDYRIDPLMLSEGLYRISVAIHDSRSATCFDKLTHVRTLRVQPADRPIHGLVDLGGTWVADGMPVVAGAGDSAPGATADAPSASTGVEDSS